MSDPQLALKRWFHKKTEPHGVKSKLAEATGYTPTQISRMRTLESTDPKKVQRVPLDMIEKAARFFNELPPGFAQMTQWLEDHPRTREVKLVGYAGAGSVAHFYSVGDQELDRVPAPDDATDTTVALEVRGESLGPLFDQWLVFYDDVRSPVTPDLIGRLCVVGLPDDRVLVKKLKASRTKGLFHLLSNMEEPLLDQVVAWAARVKDMRPR